MKFYASLTGPLLGCYLELPPETADHDMARKMMNTSSLRGLWCAIYSEAEVESSIGRFGGLKLPHKQLDYDYDAVHRERLPVSVRKIVDAIDGGSGR